MSMVGMRRSAKNSSGGGGKNTGRAGFYAKWSPPSFNKIQGSLRPNEMNQVAEPIVLVPGEYLDPHRPGKELEMYTRRFHRYVEMYNGRKMFKELTCMRGFDDHAPQNCLGCFKVDHKEWDDKQNGMRTNYVFNLAHLVPYHKKQWVKNGAPQTKKEDGSPIIITEQCHFGTVGNRVYWQGQRNEQQCPDCATGQQLVLGGHRYWSTGQNHFNALLDFNDKELGKFCFYTNTYIMHTGFKCSNCNNVLLDVASSGYTNDQLAQYEENPVGCPHCNHTDHPVRMYQNGFDQHYMQQDPNWQQNTIDKATGQMVEPRPLNIFDVVLWIQREGENTDSKPVVTRWTRITEAPFNTDGSALDLTDHVKSVVPKPFDFDGLFNLSTAKQAELLKQADPFTQGAQQNFHQYGGQQPQNYAQPGYGAAPAMPPSTPTLPPPAAPGGYAPQAAPQQSPQLPQQHAAPPQQGYPPQQAPQAPPAAPQQQPIAAPYPQPPQAPAAPPMPQAPAVPHQAPAAAPAAPQAPVAPGGRPPWEGQ